MRPKSQPRCLVAFHKKHCGPDKKVALVAINVNVIPEDRLPKMKERAEAKGFTFLYLFDETQKIGREFDANVTPEFFVFGKDRKLVYKGAMDDRNRNIATGGLWRKSSQLTQITQSCRWP